MVKHAVATLGAFALLGFAIPSSAIAAKGRQIISTPAAPAAIGPYSQAVLIDGTLYVSGQLGLLPETGKLIADDARGQAEQAIKNVTAILAAAGMAPDDVVMATIYLTDIADYAAINDIYGKVFTTPPARAVVQVAALPRGARFEIAVVASRRRR